MFCLVYARRNVPGARVLVLKVTFSLRVKTPRATRLPITTWTPCQSWVRQYKHLYDPSSRLQGRSRKSVENDEGSLREAD